VAATAPPASEDPATWGAFVEDARTAATEGKRQNVTVAVRNAPGTFCAGAADLKRLAKDVDSAWLRFAPDLAAFGALDALLGIVVKAVLAVHTLENVCAFATEGDPEAAAFARKLRRFRGFVLLERADDGAPRDAYHDALRRFRELRAAALDDTAALDAAGTPA
ncbi:MAG: hypothetical protein WCE83_06125, partial [Candidatus Baltobacteraceae bacterium]